MQNGFRNHLSDLEKSRSSRVGFAQQFKAILCQCAWCVWQRIRFRLYARNSFTSNKKMRVVEALLHAYGWTQSNTIQVINLKKIYIWQIS